MYLQDLLPILSRCPTDAYLKLVLLSGRAVEPLQKASPAACRPAVVLCMQRGFEFVRMLCCLRAYITRKPTERCTQLQHKGTLYNEWVPLTNAALDRDRQRLDADPPRWQPGSSQ